MAIGLPIASRLPVPRDSRKAALLAGGVALPACLAITAAAAMEAATRPQLVAAARTSMVAVPVLAGLFLWGTRREGRFGLLLVAMGGGWFLTTLAESSDPVLYTAGRTAGWLAEGLLVYVFLAFPAGRLPGRTDRLLVGAIGATVALLYLPRLVLAQSFQVPSPVTSCVRDCPRNALFALSREPALVEEVLRTLGLVVVFLLMLAVVARLQQRMHEATPLARRMLAPVVAVATARASLLAVGIFARWIDPNAWLVRSVAWMLAFAVPAIALASLAGVVRWRLFAGRALEQLAACVRTRPDPPTLRRAFADAFEDPSLEVAFPVARSPERWMDSRGRLVAMPEPGSGLSVSTVSDRGTPVAAIVHDEALDAHPALLHAGLAMAGVVLENHRLAAEAKAALHELQASRSRIAASAERERRRIERDLHDGAQQRLVALRIELELAEELVRRDPERGARRLHALEQDLDAALEELRALAHGVYPPLLADRGLPEAVRAVADRLALDARVDVRGVRRYAPEVESAVYFCVLEALQNVLKHARDARVVAVCLDGGGADGELRFSVRDDGAGADGGVRAGAGITNMRDRLAALGGELDVTSRRAAGTLVRGRVPASGRDAGPALHARAPDRDEEVPR